MCSGAPGSSGVVGVNTPAGAPGSRSSNVAACSSVFDPVPGLVIPAQHHQLIEFHPDPATLTTGDVLGLAEPAVGRPEPDPSGVLVEVRGQHVLGKCMPGRSGREEIGVHGDQVGGRQAGRRRRYGEGGTERGDRSGDREAGWNSTRTLLKNSPVGARDFGGDRKEWGDAGHGRDPNRELLDAAALCRHLVAEDSVHAFLADHRRDLFPDELFADLFPSGRGRPSVPADVVATVMVLQVARGPVGPRRGGGVADQHRVEGRGGPGARRRGDPLLGAHVLADRGCGRRSAPERIFDAVRAVIDATGVLAGKTSPGVGLDVARRRGRDPGHGDPVGLGDPSGPPPGSRSRRGRWSSAHDYDASGKPVCAWDDPDAKTALVSAAW